MNEGKQVQIIEGIRLIMVVIISKILRLVSKQELAQFSKILENFKEVKI